MKKKTLFISALLCALLATTQVQAQFGKFRGSVKYKIEYKGEASPQLPSEITIKLWDEKALSPELSFGGMSLSNAKVQNNILMFDFSQIPLEGVQGKWAIFSSYKNKGKEFEETFNYTDETKEIAGKTVRRVEVTIPEKEEKLSVWATTNFGPSIDGYLFEGLKGMPFSFDLPFSEELVATFEVVEITEGGVKETDLLLPTDYEELTQEEFAEIISTLMDVIRQQQGGGQDDDF